MTLSFLLRGGEGGHVIVTMRNDLSAANFDLRCQTTPAFPHTSSNLFDDQET
jgi:hypothetical protein